MKKYLALILAFSLILTLCACGSDSNDTNGGNLTNNPTQNDTQTSSKDDATPKFEVMVTDNDGNAVKGVMVQLCKDTCVPAVTDDSGVATFSLEITDGYKLSVMSCPDGYEYTGEPEIYLDEGETQYELIISKK